MKSKRKLSRHALLQYALDGARTAYELTLAEEVEYRAELAHDIREIRRRIKIVEAAARREQLNSTAI